MATYNGDAFGSAALTPSRPAPPAPRRYEPSFSSSSSTYHSAQSGATSSASSFTTAYSGVGGSPGGGGSSGSSANGPTVRSGYVSIKEDGFASWLWNKKWLVLREEVLTIHRNEVGTPSINLLYGPQV